ncbi:MAG: ABC transporter ATP-binding protein [Candidatus Binatia bacterium]
MAKVVLKNIKKHFDKVAAVEDFTAEINDGEFLSILGPSGCGKTTTLRLLAGFESPDEGEIIIGDRVVSSVPKRTFLEPEERNIGMVFQNYAVWPHMNVYKNIAYPLKIRKVNKKVMNEKAEKVLELVDLKGFGTRYPHQLSGGQQQRVALARALIMDPEVMLLDEPLSNLDAKLREEMRFEIKDLQQRTGVTIIYVTHDQAEAMAMSDRIVVMDRGLIQQIGEPRLIYERPANRFIADFIGLANFVRCTVEERDNGQGTVLLQDGTEQHRLKCPLPAQLGRDAFLSIRPENIEICKDRGDIPGVVKRKVYLGNITDYRVQVGHLEIRVESNQQEFAEGENVKLRFKRVFFFSV